MDYTELLSQLTQDFKAELFPDDVTIFWKEIRGFKFVIGITIPNAITVMGADTIDEENLEFAHATLISINTRNKIVIADTLPKSPVIVLASSHKLSQTSKGITKHPAFYPKNLYDLGSQLYGDFTKLHDLEATPYVKGKKARLQFAGDQLFGYPKLWDAYYMLPIMERM